MKLPLVRTMRTNTKRNALHKFFFLKPKTDVDSKAVMEKLFSLKNVREVIMTEGDVGYIVKTRLFSDKSDRDTERMIVKSVGSRLGVAVSYNSFRK